MQKIRWIHFSDLHLSDVKATDTLLMRKKLPTYVSSLNEHFDYAFCTGDIKEWYGSYDDRCISYLKTLCDAGHTHLDRLFIVPGNHDVNAGDPERATVIQRILNDYQSSVGTIEENDLSLLLDGEAGYRDFVGRILPGRPCKGTFVIKTEHFNLLHLDSTITYHPGHTRDFVIGTRKLIDVLEQCDETKPTIVLTHYSYDFLTQDERNEVETLLEAYHVQLWFAGHEHESLIRWQREKILECQCGNLVLQDGSRSCVLTGELDLETGEGIITVHAWYDKRGWEVYPFARVGSEDDRIFPFTLRLPGANRTYDVSVELANAREACEVLSTNGNLFADLQLNTVLLTDLECDHNYYQDEPLQRVMEKLWIGEGANHGLVLGDGGMGKSTMMYHECNRLLENKRIAVYVSLQAREGAGGSIMDYILQALYKSVEDKSRSKLISLTATRHTHPDLYLFIDGFNELSGTGAQRYVQEIKTLAQYPGVQIIISSRLDFLRDFGMSHFWMIRTCDLREAQIRGLFCDAEWRNIQAKRNLQILLKNPMMALLYSQTCPIIERHKELPYLDWIIPISNASDLLHNYYLSQVAILLERIGVEGQKVCDCLAGIEQILPKLGYLAEKKNRTFWEENDFDGDWENAVSDVAETSHIKKARRIFRIGKWALDENRAYDLILCEMCLLKTGSGTVSFVHQVFRDYLAAVYYYKHQNLWKDVLISRGVSQYLRYMYAEPLWGSSGSANSLLDEYRGKSEDDCFVANIINCWLSEGEGIRDLSRLDLRGVSLATHLRVSFQGEINIDRARVSKQTFVNDLHHDRILRMAFSHDNRMLAAVSANGLISITNIPTQSQMIVGNMQDIRKIGFDAEDYLIAETSRETYIWQTIDYTDMQISDHGAVILSVITPEMKKKADALYKQLKDSDLLGCFDTLSEDGRYRAIGFESGFIQIWDAMTQESVADLSLGDSQIATLSFNKEGSIAALGAGGRLVQIWGVANKKCLKTLFFEQRVIQVAFRPNGNLITRFSNSTACEINLNDNTRRKFREERGSHFISPALLKKLNGNYATIDSAPHGNAIIIDRQGRAYTWDERHKTLNSCPGHQDKVTCVAICKNTDERFAASYSNERYSATKSDRKNGRADIVDNQKLVRVRIVKTGQCQWRLPTQGRTITKLQFFTTNRIVLAAFASNGDILLWELTNEIVYGREHGHWDRIQIVRNNQAAPIECAVPEGNRDFISAYSDGSILIRNFHNTNHSEKIRMFPGIDASVLRWTELDCDEETMHALKGYKV